jgi:hypothetical protein
VAEVAPVWIVSARPVVAKYGVKPLIRIFLAIVFVAALLLNAITDYTQDRRIERLEKWAKVRIGAWDE